MSEPQQPDLPPYAQPTHAFPSAPPPAQPQPYPQAQGYSQAPGYPNAAPGYGAGYGAGAGSGNPLARTAFVVALIVLGLGLLLSLLGPIVHIVGDYDYVGYELINLASTAVSLAGGLAALILGIVAARRPGSHVLAGFAIGIGATQVAGTVVVLLSSLLYRFL